MSNKFDKLQLIEKLSEGGSHFVYRGIYADQPAIVKYLRSPFSERNINRLRQEHDILKELDGKCSPTIIDFFEYNDTPFLVYSDQGAQSLTKLLSERTFELSEIYQIALETAKALESIHGLKIVHKDINPNNICYNSSTKRVEVIDFGISTRLIRHRQDKESRDIMEGTLQFLSPEQTGKTSHYIDHRTDFFAFGSTLYYLITGQYAFDGGDRHEIIHRVLAGSPNPISTLRPDCPVSLAKIVEKLVSKHPNDRYDSARGLVHDLLQSESLYKSGQSNLTFELGEADVVDTLRIPDKIYGRQTEIEVLQQRFHNATMGKGEFVEIAGTSGIGKTALIQQLEKHIHETRSITLSGKFEQFKRSDPYGIFKPILKQLASHLSQLPEKDLNGYLERVSREYGSTVKCLTVLCKELEGLFSDLPDVPALEGESASRRIRDSLLGVLRLLPTNGNALVLFVDDLQWSDSSSIEALRKFIDEIPSTSIFLIVAYRDNEMPPSHPASLMLTDCRKADGTGILKLGPLDQHAINQLLVETVGTLPNGNEALTTFLLSRTSGNPFYLRKVLDHLYQENVIGISVDSGSWHLEIDKLNNIQVSDNVVNFLLQDMEKLSSTQRELLCAGACLGRTFHLEEIETYTNLSGQLLTNDTLTLVSMGMLDIVGDINTSDDTSKEKSDSGCHGEVVFVHDKIQQASYELFDAETRATLHHKIGTAKFQEYTNNETDADIFVLVNHLNLSIDLSNETQQCNTALLNLTAGQTAMDSGSYEEAETYFSNVIRQLPKSHDSYNQVTTSARFGLARVFHAEGKHDACLELLDRIQSTTQDKHLIALSMDLRCAIFIATKRYEDTIQTGLKGMSIMGFKASRYAPDLAVVLNVAKFKALHLNKVIRYLESSVDEASDSDTQLLFDLTLKVLTAAFYVDQNLFVLILQKMFIRIHRKKIAVSHVTLVIALAMMIFMIRDVKSAKKLQTQAKLRLQKHGEDGVFPMFYIPEGHWMGTWEFGYRECYKINQIGYQKAAEYGDPGIMGSNAFLSLLNALGGGFRLDELQKISNNVGHFFKEVNPQNYYVSVYYSLSHMIKYLRGETISPDTLGDEEVSEEYVREKATQSPGDMSIFKTMKAWSLFSNGNLREAFLTARFNLVQKILPGCFTGAINTSIIALSILRSRKNDQPKAVRSRWIGNAIVRFCILELRWWNAHKIINKGFRDLVLAEFSESKGRFEQAIDHYNKAIQHFTASQNYYWLADSHRALGLQFHERSLNGHAAYHLDLAISKFSDYGAHQFARELKEEFGKFIDLNTWQSTRGTTSTSTSTGTNTANSTSDLDIETISKAALTISEGTNSDNLLEKILRIAMENVGSTNGAIVSKTGDGEVLETSAKFDESGELICVTPKLQLSEFDNDIPTSVVRYVLRTGSSVMLNTRDEMKPYKSDPYIAQSTKGSIVCIPMDKAEGSQSVLLLENRLTENAFTDSRLRTLKILGSQGAIALANSRFVLDIQSRNEIITDLKVKLERLLEVTKLMASSQTLEATFNHAITAICNENSLFESLDFVVLVQDESSSSLTKYTRSSSSSIKESSDLTKEDFAKLEAAQEIKEVRNENGFSTIPVRWKSKTLAIISIADQDALAVEIRAFIGTLAQSLALAVSNIIYQHNLHGLVQSRTNALNESLELLSINKEKIRAIIQNIDQGILTFDRQMKIESEHSKLLKEIFSIGDREIAGQDIASLIIDRFNISKEAKDRVTNTLKAAMGEDEVTWMLNEDNLPSRTTAGSTSKKILDLDWTPIYNDDQVNRVLLSVRDITDRLAAEEMIRKRDLEHDRKLKALSQMIKVDKGQLGHFLSNSCERLEGIIQVCGQDNPDYDSIYRDLHTVKGGAITFGFEEIANQTHTTESVVNTLKKAKSKNSNLNEVLEAGVESLLEDVRFLEQVFKEVFGADSSSEDWSLFTLGLSINPRLRSLCRKNSLTYSGLVISDRVTKWSAKAQHTIAEVIPHVISNAIDHGYTLKNSKKPVLMEIESQYLNDEIVIEIRDFGEGLDHDTLRTFAKKHGIPSEDYLNVVFKADVSAAKSVSLSSGRGVGLGAVKVALEQIDGTASIHDNPAGGTIVRLTLPANDSVQEFSDMERAS